MALPMRGARRRRGRKTPRGRFWIGKSVARSWADSTKLRSCSSWVASISSSRRHAAAASSELAARSATGSAKEHEPKESREVAPDRAIVSGASRRARARRRRRPSKTKACAASSRSTRLGAAHVDAGLRAEGGGHEDVQEAVHDAARAVGGVGERVLRPQRMVQAGRGLEGQAQRPRRRRGSGPGRQARAPPRPRGRRCAPWRERRARRCTARRRRGSGSERHLDVGHEARGQRVEAARASCGRPALTSTVSTRRAARVARVEALRRARRSPCEVVAQERRDAPGSRPRRAPECSARRRGPARQPRRRHHEAAEHEGVGPAPSVRRSRRPPPPCASAAGGKSPA